MVAPSRSSLMFIQSDCSRGCSPVKDTWEEEFQRKRQLLKERCKELTATFCPKSGRSAGVEDCQSVNRDTIPNFDSFSIGLGISRDSEHCSASVVDRQYNNCLLTSPDHHSSGASCQVNQHSVAPQDVGGYTSAARSPCTLASSNLRREVTANTRRYSNTSLSRVLPLRLLLHCQGGLGTSTPSSQRSLEILDLPLVNNRDNHCSRALTRRGSRGISQRSSRLPNYTGRDARLCYAHYNRPEDPSYLDRGSGLRKGIGRYQDSGSHIAGDTYHRGDKLCKSNIAYTSGKYSSYRDYKMRDKSTRHKQADASFPPEEAGFATPARRGNVTPVNSHEGPRALTPQSKIDSNYIDRLLSGQTVSLDVLKAAEFGSSESSRYIISICREVFMAVIGAQLVYVVTSVLFGNIAAAIIVTLLCVQSGVCHCDGRPVAYVINGVLSVLVATTITVALCRDVTGLEPYRQDPVLNMMSYIYVPLCFCFGIFSFFLAHNNYDLQKQERRAIVQAVNRLLGDRYRINEHNLSVERSS